MDDWVEFVGMLLWGTVFSFVTVALSVLGFIYILWIVESALG